jgi:hypothetical protein
VIVVPGGTLAGIALASDASGFEADDESPDEHPASIGRSAAVTTAASTERRRRRGDRSAVCEDIEDLPDGAPKDATGRRNMGCVAARGFADYSLVQRSSKVSRVDSPHVSFTDREPTSAGVAGMHSSWQTYTSQVKSDL